MSTTNALFSDMSYVQPLKLLRGQLETSVFTESSGNSLKFKLVW